MYQSYQGYINAATMNANDCISEESSIPVSRPGHNPCRTSLTMLVWFMLSNLIILITKWLFTDHFPFPLIVTTYSNIVAFLWAAIFSCHPNLRSPLPTKHQFFTFVLPIGLTQALEIGCSNVALELLTVSFGTILKGSSPVFTFMWGLIFGLEQFSLPIFGGLLTIAIGIALASLGEGQEFQMVGFCLQLFATALGGLRWAITHKLLLEDSAPKTTIVDGDNHNSHPPVHQTMSPLTASLYTQPMTALCILPFALGLEMSDLRDRYDSTTSGDIPSSSETALILITMTGIASLVFLLLMSEYWLVKATSSLTLSVAGTLKELITIGGGIFFFADKIHLLNAVGFFTCQLGIMSYVYIRYEPPRKESYVSVVAVDRPIV